MAIGARDLYFAVRVEDRATGPLRRIAGEFRALSQRPQMLQQRLIMAQQAESRARDIRLMREQTLLSTREGTIALRNQQKVKAAQDATNLTKIKAANIEKQMLRNFAAQTALSGRMSRIKETAGSDVVRASAARDARTAAAQRYLSARSGTVAIRTQERLNKINHMGLMDDLKKAGVQQAMVRNYEAQLRNASKLQQLEMEYSADNLLAEQRALIAQSRKKGIPTRQLRNVEGVIPVGLEYEALSNEAIRLSNAEKVLAGKAGIASGAFKTQYEQTQLLSAASAEAAAKQALLASKFKTSSMNFRNVVGDRKSAAMAYLAASQQAAALAKEEETLATRAGLVPGAFSAQRLELQKVSALRREAAAAELLAANRFATADRIFKDSVESTRAAAAAVNSLDWERLAMAGGLIQRLGRVTAMFGGITVAAMGFAAHAYAKFSTESTLAATQSTTQSNNTTAGVLRNSKIISAAILRMTASGKVTSPLADQQKAIYEIFSGIKFSGSQASQLKQGIGMLKEFNRVATANFGMVDLGEVTNAGIAIVNNFGISLKNLDRVMNTTQAAVRFGKMNMKEYTTSLNQAIPAARAAGYSNLQMASTISFLSKKFPALRFGTTGYARLLQLLARYNKDFASKGIKITDPTGRRLLPLEQIISRILKKYPQLARGNILLQNFFKEIAGAQGTIQAQRVFAALAQDLPGYQKQIKLVSRDNKELARSWRAMQQSPQVRWTEFTLQIKSLVMEIAAGAIPAFAGIGHYVKSLAGWFEKLSPHTKKMIGYLITMGAILVTLAGIMAMFLGSMAILVVRMRELVGWLRVGSRALVTMGGSAGSVSVALLGTMAAIVIVATVLHHFHISLLKVITGASGLEGVLRLLSIAFAGLAIRSLIIGLTTLVPVLATATIGFEAMGASATVAMSSIVAASAAEIIAVTALGYALSKVIRLIPGVNEMGKNAGGDLYDALHPTNLSDIAKLNDSRTKNAKFGLLAPGRSAAQQMIKTINMQVYGLASRGLTPVQIKARIEKLHPNEVRHDIDVWIQHAQTLLSHGILNVPMAIVDPNVQSVERNRFLTGARNMVAEARKIAHHIRDKNVRETEEQKIPQQIAALNRLRAAAEKFPPNVAAIKRYMNYQDALQKQLKKFPNLYQAITQAADAMYGKVGSLSNAEFIREAKRVDRLMKIAKKTHSFADALIAIRAQDALSKKATDAQTAAWEMVGSKVDKVSDKLKKQKQILTDSLTSIKQMYQDMLQQNQQAFGTLFQGPFITSAFEQNNLNWGQKLNMPALTKDLQSQKNQFDKWNGYLNTLAKRGLPRSFIKQLREMGPGNPSDPNSPINNVKLLVNATPAQLKKYADLWAASQKDINATTRRQLQAQLKYYRTFGKNVALAIVRGLKSEDQALENALKQMLIQAFPSLATHHKKVTEHDKTKSKPSTGGHKPGTGTGGGKGNSVVHNDHSTTNYYFHGDPGATTKTKLKHAHFATTNKHPRQR